jgi:hypothetical protein
MHAAMVTTTSSGSDIYLDEWGERLLQNKREYAERHGYDMYVIDNDLAKPRHKYLGSLIGVLSVLRHYDWVFKVDMDTLIMDPSRPLETFLDPGFDFIAAPECYSNFDFGIQAGVYFVRNSAWAHFFMLEVSLEVAFLEVGATNYLCGMILG